MRKAIPAITSGVLFCLGLAVAGCGSSDGGTGTAADCNKVCDKVEECGYTEDAQDCRNDCPQMAGIMKASAWNYAIDCMMNLSCEQMKDPDSCLAEAAQQQPADSVDSLADGICNKAKECDDTVDVAQCVTEFKSDGDLLILRIVTDEVLNCTSNCVTEKTCEVIGSDIDTVFGQCACDCGLPFCG